MMDKKLHSGHIDGIPLLCPICGREIDESFATDEGFKCKCGEIIPYGLALDPFEGCPHGKNCNCKRERRR